MVSNDTNIVKARETYQYIAARHDAQHIRQLPDSAQGWKLLQAGLAVATAGVVHVDDGGRSLGQIGLHATFKSASLHCCSLK